MRPISIGLFVRFFIRRVDFSNYMAEFLCDHSLKKWTMALGHGTIARINQSIDQFVHLFQSEKPIYRNTTRQEGEKRKQTQENI